MADDKLFSGLDKLGLGMLSGLELYEKEEPKETMQSAEKTVAEKVIPETEYLLDKRYKCPVCESEFRSKGMKSGKAKLLGSDSDLRPRYQGVDSVKYDVVVCTRCGYAALSRYFSDISTPQIKLIKENIAPHFKGVDDKCEVYSYDEAVTRYQLALANTVVKKGKISERAYTCLKLAWLYRGQREALPQNESNREQQAKELLDIEKQYIAKAYEGFSAAMYKENYPLAGMDEWTCSYLVANLAVQCEDYTTATKLLSDIIVSKVATSKLKDKARDLRKEIQDKKH